MKAQEENIIEQILELKLQCFAIPEKYLQVLQLSCVFLPTDPISVYLLSFPPLHMLPYVCLHVLGAKYIKMALKSAEYL